MTFLSTAWNPAATSFPWIVSPMMISQHHHCYFFSISVQHPGGHLVQCLCLCRRHSSDKYLHLIRSVMSCQTYWWDHECKISCAVCGSVHTVNRTHGEEPLGTCNVVLWNTQQWSTNQKQRFKNTPQNKPGFSSTLSSLSPTFCFSFPSLVIYLSFQDENLFSCIFMF